MLEGRAGVGGLNVSPSAFSREAPPILPFPLKGGRNPQNRLLFSLEILRLMGNPRGRERPA